MHLHGGPPQNRLHKTISFGPPDNLVLNTSSLNYSLPGNNGLEISSSAWPGLRSCRRHLFSCRPRHIGWPPNEALIRRSQKVIDSRKSLVNNDKYMLLLGRRSNEQSMEHNATLDSTTTAHHANRLDDALPRPRVVHGGCRRDLYRLTYHCHDCAVRLHHSARIGRVMFPYSCARQWCWI